MTSQHASPLRPGDRVGDYQILARIGGGGYGTTYRVLNTNLHRHECLKITHRDSGVDLEEARMIAGLGLDGVAAVHGSGVHDGRAWYTMILADQGDLHHYLRRLPGPASDDTRLRVVLDLLGQVAATLDRLAGLPSPVTHGDIKPRNILVHAGTGRPRALLADFGLARASAPGPGAPTGHWTRAGTPEYVAPELWLGTSPASPETDRYAFACTAFAALVGRAAFDTGGSSDHAERRNRARFAHLAPDRPAPGQADPALSRFDPVFRRALALDPAQRYPSATAFHADLVAAHERPARRRRRLLTGAATAASVAVLAAAAIIVVPALIPDDTGSWKANGAIPQGICPPLRVSANLRGPNGATGFHPNALAPDLFVIDRLDEPVAAPAIALNAVDAPCLFSGPYTGVDGSVHGSDQETRTTFLAVFNSDDPAVLAARDELLTLIDASGRHGEPAMWKGLSVRLTADNDQISPGRTTAACVLDDQEQHFTVVELHLGSTGSTTNRGDGQPASTTMCATSQALVETWNQSYVPRSPDGNS